MIRLTQPYISSDEIHAMTEVLQSGMLVQGRRVQEFEQNLATYMQVNYVSVVSSGTAALHLALAALELGRGDAIIAPSFTFPATVNVVELQGARPVLVDVTSGSFNIDPKQLKDTIKTWNGPEKLKAIIVVHEFGAPADMEIIMNIAKEHDLYVIEDAACALGSISNGKHVGCLGDIGCFSWHPRKSITTGEGGAIVAKSESLHQKINILRNHGIQRLEDGSIDFIVPGFNYRLTEFQAVLGNLQLQRFQYNLEKRKQLVKVYKRELESVEYITLPEMIDGHSWQTFMIVLNTQHDRAKVIKCLAEKGIEANLGAQAIHMMSYYKEKYHFGLNQFPNAKLFYEKGLALPLHPLLTEEEITYISHTLREVLR
ncbi:DegT/DnrJ/EryC1/StrS aminotransferase family protein [Brevibacillus sp. MS2.2]|uniref:DegT/DnrJ/EryC1/StrS family aminotransferase n=1 Tax=Brevibacillus sp. MS2.2 TaxID=2738981 RepID=UPI00156AE1C8|nr:DegT/DnrJ/EryC1/StrS family aminotransferase [Brevibacillus sp. MS2.2]NRR23244.1 DegT/DnrJ/EryC1/StrS family aminotransferase [Brevibacillus sp. MS2.2]